MKLFTKIGSFVILAVAMVFAAGCGGIFTIPLFDKAPKENDLHGRWIVVRFREQANNSSTVTATGRGFIEFDEDGTWFENNPWHASTTQIVGGTWELEGDQLKLARDPSFGSAPFWGPTRTIRINDASDRITIQYLAGGGTWTIEYQRAAVAY